MASKKVFIFGTLMGGVVVLAVLLISTSRRSGVERAIEAAGSVSPTPSEGRLHAFGWKTGIEYRYSLDLRGEASARAGTLSAWGKTEIVGELVFQAIETRKTTTTLLAKLEAVSHHVVDALGKSLIPDSKTADAIFAGRSLLVDVTPKGEIRGFRFRKSDPALFKQVMQYLVTRCEVRLAPGDESEWTVLQTTPGARVEMKYRSDSKSPLRIDRRSARIEELLAVSPGVILSEEVKAELVAEIRLDPEGHVVSLDETESIVSRDERPVSPTTTDSPRLAFRSRFSLLLKGRGAAVAIDARTFDDGLFESRRAGERFPGPTDAQLAAQSAGDITFGEIGATIGTYDLGVRLEKGWLMKAVAYVRAKPERVKLFVEAFTKYRLLGKALIMDILSSAGHPEAQGAMRKILELPAAQVNNRLFGELIQRFSLVATPTRESIDFVEQRFVDAREKGRRDEGKKLVSFAVAHSLGSMLRRLFYRGDEALAKEKHRLLLDALKESAESHHFWGTKSLLGALGNAGLPDGFRAIAPLTKDGHPVVRANAALALRKFDDEASRTILFGMLSDKDEEAAQAALKAIGYLALTSEDLARFADAVTANQTHRGMDQAIVTFFSLRSSSAPQAAVRALRKILDRAGDDQDLKIRVRGILDSLENDAG